MRTGQDKQFLILHGLSAIFVIMAILSPQRLVLVPVGIALFVGAAWLAERIGPGGVVMEPLFVWLVAFMCLGMPVAAAAPPREIGFVASLIGSFCAQGYWAVFRYPTKGRPDTTPVGERVRASVKLGLLFAVGFSVIAAAIIGISTSTGGVSEAPSSGDFLLVVAAYFLAGLLGGAAAGVLRPLARWPLGAMVAGIPATALVYSAIGLAMFAMEAGTPDQMSLGESLAIGAGIGLLVGPAAGLLVRGMRLGGSF